MTLYSKYEVDSLPAWLAGLAGRAYHYVVGLAKDAWVEAAKQAVKARFAAIAPKDALTWLLRDYDLDQPYRESVQGTRDRLANAWAMHQLSGTKLGIITAMNVAGFGNVQVQENVTPGRHWEFRVVLRPPLPWDYAILPFAGWGWGWSWGDGYRWQSAAPSRYDIDRALAIVRKWKPARAQLIHIAVQIHGPYWGEFTWGDGTEYGGLEDNWT